MISVEEYANLTAIILVGVNEHFKTHNILTDEQFKNIEHDAVLKITMKNLPKYLSLTTDKATEELLKKLFN